MLFISPAAPRPAGNGLAMRAAVSLEGLSSQHDVRLALVRYDESSLAWAREQASIALHWGFDETPEGARSWLNTARGREAAAVALPDLVRQRPPAIGQRIVDTFGASFDVVLVMRVYLAGVALPFLEAGIPGVLDADDDEPSARRSFASVDPAGAVSAPDYEAFQRVAFPWFERVLFASADDAVAPHGQLPNAVEIPTCWRTRAAAEPLELLFVGTPRYAPNRDALRRLRERVLPAIAAMGVNARLHHPRLDEDVGPYYERAHLALVPLRAGGGTRIKVLEAFAHGCPVVATPTGASGLSVTSGRELLVTDNDEDGQAFAAAVVELATDDARRLRLARAARRFVEEHHDRAMVGRRLADLVTEVAARR